MGFENTTLKDYYFINDRESFSIEPWRDSSVFFGDERLSKRIEERIESDFVQPRTVPKFFLYGNYGAGKTHGLAYIRHLLETRFSDMFPTHSVYLDIAPLGAKEKYERIHARLLDAIGFDRVKAAAVALAEKTSSDDKIQAFQEAGAVPAGEEALRVSQANTFRNLLYAGKQAQQSWEWMKGRKSSADDAQTLGVQKDLAGPQDFVNSLVNIGALHKVATGERIVFLIDEAEAFRNVTNPDSQRELEFSLRLLLENSNPFVGLIMAIQAEGGMEDIGEFFTRRDIMRRVDYEQGYVDLNGVVQAVEDAQTFVREVISYLVDDGKAKETVENESLETSAELFPFTEDAVTAISTQTSANLERALPAAIIAWMGNAAVAAWRHRSESDRHQLVTAERIEETIFPEG